MYSQTFTTPLIFFLIIKRAKTFLQLSPSYVTYIVSLLLFLARVHTNNTSTASLTNTLKRYNL